MTYGLSSGFTARMLDGIMAENWYRYDGRTFENGIWQWATASSGGCTVARSTAQAHTGAASLALTATAAGQTQGWMAATHCTDNATGRLAYGLPCAAGDLILVSGMVRAATAARTGRIGVAFSDAAGAFLSTVNTAEITDSTSAWTKTAGLVTAPASSAFAEGRLLVNTVATDEVHYLDNPHLGVLLCWARLHTDDPGAAGTANASSVTTRQRVQWSPSDAGVLAEGAVPDWGTWAGTSPETLRGLSLWTASSGGLFIGSVPLSSPVVVTTGAPLTLPTFTITWGPVAA